MPSALPAADFVAARFPFPGFAVDHFAFPDLGGVPLALGDGEAVFLAFSPLGALGVTP